MRPQVSAPILYIRIKRKYDIQVKSAKNVATRVGSERNSWSIFSTLLRNLSYYKIKRYNTREIFLVVQWQVSQLKGHGQRKESSLSKYPLR